MMKLVDFIMGLLREHLTAEEYHRLFLRNEE
jgi:hypothetical protein